MKFLVTGANGQLGREWVRYLEMNNLPFTAYHSSRLNITNSANVEEVFATDTPDVVLNCAAYTNVDLAEKERDQAWSVNSNGSGILAEICNKQNIKLVHYSTDYVFRGNSEDMKKYPGGYPEDAEIAPVNVYGKSKAAGEKQITQKMENYLMIRVSWLCGAFGSNFVKTMLRLAETRPELNIVADQIGSPAFTGDVVEKTMGLLNSGKKGIFHCSSHGSISWADFAEAVFRFSEKKTVVHRISSSEYKTDAKRPEFSLLSKQKLEQAGLQPLDWQKGLRELLRELEFLDINKQHNDIY